MAIRRTNAPRKRATTATAVVSPVAPVAKTVEESDDDQVDVDATGTTDPQEIARGLLSEIEGALRDAPAVDEKEREVVIELFAKSLREVIDSGVYVNPPSESEWQAGIELLKQRSAEADGDDGSLARQLASAVATLEQRTTQVTLEFSRRMQVDGQESALAWLKEQHEASGKTSPDAVAPEPPTPTPLSALRGEVTKSRSRRLRGPPQ